MSNPAEQHLTIKEIESMSGCIYAAESPHGVKIGMSKNPYSRLKSVMRSQGHKGKSYISDRFVNYAFLERLAHDHFNKYRGVGEHFSVDLNVATEAIKEICKTHGDKNFIAEKERVDERELGMSNLMSGLFSLPKQDVDAPNLVDKIESNRDEEMLMKLQVEIAKLVETQSRCIAEGYRPALPTKDSTIVGELIQAERHISELFSDELELTTEALDLVWSALESISKIAVLLGLPATHFTKTVN